MPSITYAGARQSKPLRDLDTESATELGWSIEAIRADTRLQQDLPLDEREAEVKEAAPSDYRRVVIAIDCTPALDGHVGRVTMTTEQAAEAELVPADDVVPGSLHADGLPEAHQRRCVEAAPLKPRQ